MQLYVINPPAHPAILHCSVLPAGTENAPPALSCNLLPAFGKRAAVISRGLWNVLLYGLLASGTCRLTLFHFYCFSKNASGS